MGSGAPKTHDPNSPSALPRRALCPGSYHLEKLAGPRPGSPDADYGTRLHDHVAQSLKSANPEEYVAGIDDLDMRWPVDRCVRFARNYCMVADKWAVEVPVKLFALDGSQLTYGTADLICVTKTNVIVIDWKAYREPLDDSHSVQLEAYAVAAAQLFKRTEAVGCFYLPFLDHEQQFSIVESGGYFHAVQRLENIVRACVQPDAALQPNEHCRYCSALPRCPAMLAELESSLTTVEELKEPDNAPAAV